VSTASRRALDHPQPWPRHETHDGHLKSFAVVSEFQPAAKYAAYFLSHHLPAEGPDDD
jgi:hypothetical protein